MFSTSDDVKCQFQMSSFEYNYALIKKIKLLKMNMIIQI